MGDKDFGVNLIELIDRDQGFAKLLKRALEGTKPLSLTVGIHEEEGAQPYEPVERASKKKGGSSKTKKPPPEITLAQIGEIHEFGTDDERIPARSWLGDWFDENEEKITDDIFSAVQGFVFDDPRELRQIFNQLGNLYVADIQKRIAQRIEPPLAQYTIDRKGSSVPLIDTGQFRGAITYKVRRA